MKFILIQLFLFVFVAPAFADSILHNIQNKEIVCRNLDLEGKSQVLSFVVHGESVTLLANSVTGSLDTQVHGIAPKTLKITDTSDLDSITMLTLGTQNAHGANGLAIIEISRSIYSSDKVDVGFFGTNASDQFVENLDFSENFTCDLM